MTKIYTEGSPHKIYVDGLDELTDYLEDLKLSPEDEIRAVKKAMAMIGTEVEKETPVRTGALKESKIISVRRKGFITIGYIKLDEFYGFFHEYGTSNSKKHVGFFSRAVRSGEEKGLDHLIFLIEK